MNTACAKVVGNLIRLYSKPLVQHVVSRGRRSNAYFISMMRHRSLMNPYAPTHRNTHLEWNYDAEVYAFSHRLGEKFDMKILHTALLDRSQILHQQQQQEESGIKPTETPEDNYKLAETGKVLLRSVVDRYLRTALPKFPEEGIEQVRNYLCGDEVSLGLGKDLGLDELILTPTFPCPDDMIIKAYHALIGAVFESSGLERAALFVRDFVIVKLNSLELNSLWMPEDPVGYLNSLLEKDGHSQVEPRLIHQCGMNTIFASYRVGMYLDKKYLGAGNGESVDEAVRLAALDVLWKIWETTDEKISLPFNIEPKAFLKTPSPLPLMDENSKQSLLQSESTTA